MRVHFIAVGGSAMHNLAIALKQKGHEVTGSDDAIYEPSRSRLEKYGILPSAMGWYPENIHEGLDAVILGMHARADNPELLKAKDLNLKIYSYPEYIFEQSKEKRRIVVGGSHGKTTITSMIIHVLQKCGLDFDYMVGAQLEGFETMVRLSDAPVMVIEGDEYLTSPIDRRPKFHVYQANIGIISGIAWDHINVFPTFDNYVEQFKIFLETIVPGGTIVYNQEDAVVNKIVNESAADVAKKGYAVPAHHTDKGTTFLDVSNKIIPLLVFGRHNLSNIEAAHRACAELGIADDQFYDAISSFKGASKRLELLGKNEETSVFKDFAHSPSKLKATIEAVKEQFPDRELVAAIELHTFSSLNREFLNEYRGTMDKADVPIVFINRHTFEQKKMEPYGENVVKEAFGNGKLNFFNNNEILVEFLSSINYKRKNLLLMSSGDFGGLDLAKIAERVLGK
ncbi:UDP-N-acetylmuramate--L-alanine ligase [Arcticibacter sp. MXS-1]|uniref:UDP-N-acetylmuramate--L-alanine ligase n=1 Tax=Arcticibacter sp. MXS-1 TaxID=3341726 RepID=UPI0035A85232